MVRAWYMNDDKKNPRDEHQKLPPEFITLEDLHKITGVEYLELNVDTYKSDGSLEKLKKDREFMYQDELTTPDDIDLNKFYTEHLHTDEEIRFVIEGCGYYDVRDKDDKWIRVEVVAGDVIVVPGGCYHRFMLDHKNSFRAIRLFKNDPNYQAHNRPADDLKCRQEYVKKVAQGAFQQAAE